jgi:hypothetical protein
MNAALVMVVLAGSALASATELTGRELALLQVILRRSMSVDQHAAYERDDALTKGRVSPLGLISNDPNLDELHEIMTSEANDEYKRFNAARALAFLGDTRCIYILAKTLAGEFAMTSSGFEQSHAAACLLYLGYDFPKDFLFTRLPNPLYPELNVFLEDPNHPTGPTKMYSERYDYPSDPNLPYTSTQIVTIVTASFVYLQRPVKVRGPLTVADIEQRELQFILDLIAELGIPDWTRVPFRGLEEDWLGFKKQMRAGDLIYYFTTDDIDWRLLTGAEGYVLIREGKVVDMIVTGIS